MKYYPKQIVYKGVDEVPAPMEAWYRHSRASLFSFVNILRHNAATCECRCVLYTSVNITTTLIETLSKYLFGIIYLVPV